MARNHRELRSAAIHLSKEWNEPFIRTGFNVAEMFHANFYHGFMEDFQISDGREEVRDFVHLLLPTTPRDLPANSGVR